ncbi:MAG: ParA family protein [Ignavibacteriae bacterium]|nr:ParA family protein [Ignavibacteriota bacterium]
MGNSFMGKIISVVLPKGGVGKTTSAVNLAYYFAKKKYKTLIIDLDPIATCSFSLGFNKENIFGDIFDVFSYSKSIEAVIHPTGIDNLDCIPQIKLSKVEEGRQLKLISNEYLLRNIIKTISTNYRFIIFDCPPYLFGPTNLALIASDSVLIPIRTDEYSFEALDDLINRIDYINKTYNQKLTIEGIFITSYEKNIRASFKVKAKLFELKSAVMLNKSIPKDANMMNATFSKRPLGLASPSSRAAVAYKELAEEIILRNFGII